MNKVFAGIGFSGFAALCLLHVASLYRIAVYYGPELHWIAAAVAGLLWLAFVGLVGRGMYVQQLRLPMGAVFGYGMIVLFAGMRVLDGVPSTIGESKWRDPNHVLTAKTEFVLHNHGEVKRALSKREYDLSDDLRRRRFVRAAGSEWPTLPPTASGGLGAVDLGATLAPAYTPCDPSA
jgi:hypothetical protein